MQGNLVVKFGGIAWFHDDRFIESALNKREQVGIDDVDLRRDHAVRTSRDGYELLPNHFIRLRYRAS
jgi:hypothetical protein